MKLFPPTLLVLFLVFSNSIAAKDYDVTISPCDIGSNCKKCYEVIKLTYIVDLNTKQVFISGKDMAGKDIKEAIEKCQITDVNNWICNSSQLITNAKNGVISITNKPESSLVRSKKEVCLFK